MAEHPEAEPKEGMSPMATSVTIHRERETRIARLEERLRRELLSVDERCELRDRIIRLKIKAGAR